MISANQYWWYAADRQLAERIIRVQDEGLAEFCAQFPGRFVALSSVALQHPELAADQLEYAVNELGFKGASVGGHVNGDVPASTNFDPFWERCVELGLHVEIHTGQEEIPGTRAKYQDPVYIDDIAVDFPELRIYQLHCGIMNNPRQAIWNAIRHANVYTDISPAVLQVMNLPYTNNLEHIKMLEAVIPHKVFFGSDAPLNIVTYKSSIEWVKCLPLSIDFKKKLLYDNAREFYLGEWRQSYGKK